MQKPVLVNNGLPFQDCQRMLWTRRPKTIEECCSPFQEPSICICRRKLFKDPIEGLEYIANNSRKDILWIIGKLCLVLLLSQFCCLKSSLLFWRTLTSGKDSSLIRWKVQNTLMYLHKLRWITKIERKIRKSLVRDPLPKRHVETQAWMTAFHCDCIWIAGCFGKPHQAFWLTLRCPLQAFWRHLVALPYSLSDPVERY